MTKTTLFMAMLGVLTLTFSQNTFAKLSFDPKYPLYLRDSSKYGFDEVEKAFTKAYAAGKDVVLFVHGRGSEPNKSLDSGTFVEGGAVRKIEDGYNAKVVMFNWNSKAFLYDRTQPLSHMNESADSLAIVLQKLEFYLQAHPKLKKPMLIAHSMGSIVMETYIKRYGWFPMSRTNLFSKVLFTSPDADNVNHWSWLNDIGRNEKVFLTINKNDSILVNSFDDRDPGISPLGLRPVAPYSDQINYLELTDVAGAVHEAFNKDNMKFQSFYCQIFDRLIHGADPQITEANTQATVVKNYFKVRPAVDKKDACFKY